MVPIANVTIIGYDAALKRGFTPHLNPAPEHRALDHRPFTNPTAWSYNCRSLDENIGSDYRVISYNHRLPYLGCGMDRALSGNKTIKALDIAKEQVVV
jgi:hypothetical protein